MLEPEGRLIEAAGIPTFVIDRGQGPAVVLLHGASLAMDAWLTWYRTIPALAGACRVVTFDQVGFGRSGQPPGNRYLNRLERVPHAWAVLDALKVERAVLVGHSEGAFMAARMAIEKPDRVAKLTLVTSGGTSPILGGSLDDGWVAASKAAYDVTGATSTEDGAVRGDPHLRLSADAEYEAILRENFQRALKSGSHAMFQNLPATETDRALYPKLQEQHLFPHFPALRCPTLLIWTRKDATVPVERGLKLMDMIPGSEMHVLPDAMHMVMHDQAAAFNRVLHDWCTAAEKR